MLVIENDLDVVIDCRLSWSIQCEIIVHKAYKQFSLLRWTWNFISDSNQRGALYWYTLFFTKGAGCPRSIFTSLLFRLEKNVSYQELFRNEKIFFMAKVTSFINLKKIHTITLRARTSSHTFLKQTFQIFSYVLGMK